MLRSQGVYPPYTLSGPTTKKPLFLCVSSLNYILVIFNLCKGRNYVWLTKYNWNISKESTSWFRKSLNKKAVIMNIILRRRKIYGKYAVALKEILLICICIICMFSKKIWMEKLILLHCSNYSGHCFCLGETVYLEKNWYILVSRLGILITTVITLCRGLNPRSSLLIKFDPASISSLK